MIRGEIVSMLSDDKVEEGGICYRVDEHFAYERSGTHLATIKHGTMEQCLVHCNADAACVGVNYEVHKHAKASSFIAPAPVVCIRPYPWSLERSERSERVSAPRK